MFYSHICKKAVIGSEWIEGNGTIQIWIRTLTNCASPTEEQTKLQLLEVTEKKPGANGPHTLQYAIDRRKGKSNGVFYISHLLPFHPGVAFDGRRNNISESIIRFSIHTPQSR